MRFLPAEFFNIVLFRIDWIDLCNGSIPVWENDTISVEKDWALFLTYEIISCGFQNPQVDSHSHSDYEMR